MIQPCREADLSSRHCRRKANFEIPTLQNPIKSEAIMLRICASGLSISGLLIIYASGFAMAAPCQCNSQGHCPAGTYCKVLAGSCEYHGGYIGLCTKTGGTGVQRLDIPLTSGGATRRQAIGTETRRRIERHEQQRGSSTYKNRRKQQYGR